MNSAILDKILRAIIVFLHVEKLGCTNSSWKRVNNIRKRGAMSKLVSDCGQSEISNKVLDILRNYTIDDWQSEPYHEHQNPAERRYQIVKQHTNAVLDKSGAPPKTWLLALLYAIYLLNHVASESLGWKTPLELLT